MEPFIDTIVVCTFTALIILSTGVWNRAPDVAFDTLPDAIQSEAGWRYPDTNLAAGEWRDQEPVLMVVEAGLNPDTSQNVHRITGAVSATDTGFIVSWQPLETDVEPSIVGGGFYKDYVGATLTAKAFDSVAPGLGKWLITVASWLFAISTIIAWGYYGEQGAVYMWGRQKRVALPVNLLLPDIHRHAGSHKNQRRPGQHDGDRAGHYHLCQSAHLLDIRLPGHACIQGLHPTPERRAHGGRITHHRALTT